MRAEELLDTLTDDELKNRANACFAEAENREIDKQPVQRQHMLFQADFYLQALNWRHDARIARRDFRLEIAVIVLIGIEILLSVYGLWEGHQQGKLIERQTAALNTHGRHLCGHCRCYASSTRLAPIARRRPG